MIVFYKKHLEFITEHAVDPDKRRYATEEEAARHYIDIDHYGEYPYANVPRRWNEAVAIYTEDTLKAYGIVPWHTEKTLYNLTEAFKKTRIFDQQSRLFPVFINLLNNSIYWLSTADQSDRTILVDVIDTEVVISDNGPGVDTGDIESLFTLFFTKKARGGRGVVLYLSRANLSAGGHRIRYEPNSTDMPLPGANFLIDFRGAEFDGG